MTCQYFDEVGLLRDERGEDDRHLAECPDCQARRAEYQKLREALAETGGEHAPRPGWEDRVFAAIDREAAAPRPSRRAWWAAAGALAVAAGAILWWQLGRTPPRDQAVAEVEILRGETVVRARGAAVGDGVRATEPGPRGAVWIYRGDALALACSRVEGPPTAGRCTLTATAITAELRELGAATYTVVRAQTEQRAPATLDLALALLARAEARARTLELVVE